MDTTKLQNALNHEKQAKDSMFAAFHKQLTLNLDDLRTLSSTYEDSLLAQDNQLLCPDMFKISLFDSKPFKDAISPVYLNTTDSKIYYNYFDSDLGDTLPAEVNDEQVKILLTIDTNFDKAMYATNPTEIITTTARLVEESANALNTKVNDYPK